MILPLRRLLHAAVPLVGILLAGCATHESLTSYFVLTANPPASAVSGTQAAVHGVRVFIRRVDVPGYLQTTKLTTRLGENEVRYSPTAQWAEPLNEGITHAVENAIGRSSRVTVVGVAGGGVPPERDDDLKIDIERFEGNDHGDVVLVATWSLYAPESSAASVTRRSRFVQTGWHYGDYPALARLLGIDLNELGAEIARSAASR